MPNMLNLSLEELRQVLKSQGVPEFHAKQVFSWIYKRGANDFAGMSDLSAALRKKLAENFSLYGIEIQECLKSADGTQKLLFKLGVRDFVEGVIIPAEGRVTGCVSSQVGCKFSCKFCASGQSGFIRNLSCAEIIQEIIFLKHYAPENQLTHVVFMGTGEPLDNYDNVLKAIRIVNCPDGLNIGARRITISTCGLIPGIRRLAQEGLQVELSVSLHAAEEKMRSAIMPINKKYPLRDLIPACRDYSLKTGRQVTFEYLLIKGLNSDLQNAQKLCTMMRSLKLSKVNLIPSNPVPEFKQEPPTKLEVLFFRDYLLKHGVNVTLRKPRGKDIEAACGQLRLKYEK